MARVSRSETTRNELKEMFAGNRGGDRSARRVVIPEFESRQLEQVREHLDRRHAGRGADHKERIPLTNFRQSTDLTNVLSLRTPQRIARIQQQCRPFLPTMSRAASAVVSMLALSGCLMMVMAAARTQPDGKANFEGSAEGKLFSDYIEACYWKGHYDPLRSLCGRLIESRESAEGIEHVHALNHECVYSFLVDKKTRVIKSWRYLSAPEGCWVETSPE